jgi:hypothetical protein
VSGDATLGALTGRPSMRGVFGIVVVRDHSVTVADAQGLFALRHHFGPYEADTLADGGRMNGIEGARWMVNHGLFPQPFNASGESFSNSQLAAAPDRAARRSDYVVLNRGAGLQPESLRTVRAVTACDSFWYRSPFDIDPGFFVRAALMPDEPLPPNPVAGISPLARRLAEGAAPTSGLPMRVIASANSRGVKAEDGLGLPANYAHGLTQALRPRVAGMLMRPATTSNAGPYFGLYSNSSANDRVRRSADCLPIYQTNYSRFWTGSLDPVSIAAGLGSRLINPGSFFALRCRPEEGSLLNESTRVTVRAYLLAYPGAPVVQVSADVGPSQAGAGAQTPVDLVDLDTTSAARTTTVAQAASVWVIETPGDMTSGASAVTPGMAVSIGSGAARGDISVVQSAVYLSNTDLTRFTLEHPFVTLPEVGAVAMFGEHRIQVVEHTHPSAVAPNTWRGIEIRRMSGEDKLDAVLFAFDAFNPDDGGFAVGPAGWSGRGYERQINEAFAGGLRDWIASAGADLWLSYIAHQLSDTESMAWFTDEIRAAIPGVEVAWVGCVEYENTIHESWQRFILDRAKSEGLVGLTVLDHPTLGSYRDLGADGAMTDGGHPTGRGHLAIANAALDILRTAARWPGDANNDARVDFADLNTLLSNFGTSGPSDGSLVGDVNLDGFVDFSDLNAVLSNFGSSVFD